MSYRAKLLRLPFGLSNSISSTRIAGLIRVNSTQVTRFSQIHLNSPSKTSFTLRFPNNLHQHSFFSTNSESFIDIVSSSNDWSNEIENQLDNANPNLSHESVSYILMQLNANPQKSLDFFKWVRVKKGFCASFSPYLMLLRTLACGNFMNEFWNVFAEMKEKGFYFHFRAYMLILSKLKFENLSKESVKWTKRYREMVESDGDKEFVEGVLSLIISSCDWGKELENLLKKKGEFPLKESLLLRLIGALYEQPLKALKFFEWIEGCGGYDHNSATYNAVAQVLARPELVNEFWDFVKRMRVKGYDIDMYTYVRSCSNLPNKDAVELFELMLCGAYRPSEQQTVSLLIKISKELEPDLDLVYRVFNKFVGAGNAPSKSVYDGLHKALCKLGRFDEAKKIVEDMRKSGYKPDNFTYGQEVLGLCKSGRVDEACKVLEHMEVEGCVPNINTWTLLIDCLIGANRMDLALSCFETMKKKDVTQSPETFSVLVKGFISKNEVLEAYRFLLEATTKESELKPSFDTFRLIMEKLAEDGKVDEALVVLRLMKKLGIRVYPTPITSYISKCGTVGDAKRLLTVLSPSFHSSLTVYRKVIGAFFEQGRLPEVRDLVLSSPLHVRQDGAIREMFGSSQAPPLVRASAESWNV
ncbi:hypothetical protein vseg_013937 [Gypsophila vaccaria]